jgi:hypothetical protein
MSETLAHPFAWEVQNKYRVLKNKIAYSNGQIITSKNPSQPNLDSNLWRRPLY